jgi:hypothetical protein
MLMALLLWVEWVNMLLMMKTTNCIASTPRALLLLPRVQLRLLELSKLGFSRVVVPAAGGPLALGPGELGGMAVSRQHSLGGALQELFGEETLRRAGWYRKKKEKDEREGAGASGGGSGSRGSRRPSRAVSDGSSDGGIGQEQEWPRTRGGRRR